MILSMTGYGRSTLKLNDIQYSIEIKTLNSKTSDIRCRIPGLFAEREMQIRKLVTDEIVRGRIELNVTAGEDNGTESGTINYKLMKKYISEIKAATTDLSLSDSDIFTSVMRIPGVNNSSSEIVSDEDYQKLEIALLEAAKALKIFRKDEGKVLAKDMQLRIDGIKSKLNDVLPLETSRISKLKERLQKNLEEFISPDRIDNNRFEQEIIYYLEKIDITEEKVRLEQHCNYFEEQLNNQEEQVGRILGFIGQEMGREINTLGSKAQDGEMQKIVVIMKDELEKVKEQISNIL
jgi:uncharacterized protein (TIGR00255 family)